MVVTLVVFLAWCSLTYNRGLGEDLPGDKVVHTPLVIDIKFDGTCLVFTMPGDEGIQPFLSAPDGYHLGTFDQETVGKCSAYARRCTDHEDTFVLERHFEMPVQSLLADTGRKDKLRCWVQKEYGSMPWLAKGPEEHSLFIPDHLSACLKVWISKSIADTMRLEEITILRYTLGKR